MILAVNFVKVFVHWKLSNQTTKLCAWNINFTSIKYETIENRERTIFDQFWKFFQTSISIFNPKQCQVLYYLAWFLGGNSFQDISSPTACLYVIDCVLNSVDVQKLFWLAEVSIVYWTHRQKNVFGTIRHFTVTYTELVTLMSWTKTFFWHDLTLCLYKPRRNFPLFVLQLTVVTDALLNGCSYLLPR